MAVNSGRICPGDYCIDLEFGRFIRVSRAVEDDPCPCSQSDVSVVQQSWKRAVAPMNAKQRLDTFVAVLIEVGEFDGNLARLLRYQYIMAARRSPTVAAELFLGSWDFIVNTYPDAEELTARVRLDAVEKTDLTRTFYGNARLIARSLLK